MRPKRQTSGFPRVGCSVEGCRRGTTRIRQLPPGHYWLDTGTSDPGWLCGEHWRRVPRALKRRHRLFAARFKLLWPDGGEPADEATWRRALLLEKTIVRSWARIIRYASGPTEHSLEEIERIFGVDR